MKLKPEQIKNWREVLCSMIGPFAAIMPESAIEKFAERLQARINLEESERTARKSLSITEMYGPRTGPSPSPRPGPCLCDPKMYGATTDERGTICNKCKGPRP